ncbi:LacI family DNA-binding transcriptional regulator [Nibricoccus sp. IMCC34717]|uniref:LacI family DNA-binding transcriptional regulator n=1 Tax=Nibricoccus sp. IMCC34717 TaxID=3034021 RepID=UPI00384CE649
MVPPHRNAAENAETRRPTLKDVAKHAGGVHPSTVSLAMRNHPGISEALRKRIKAAAVELGYRPDPMLDAFNTHRVAVQSHRAHSTIAWVLAVPDRAAAQADPHLAALWEGARSAADHFHCQLEAFYIGPGQLTPSRLNTVLRTRGITGVIFVRIPESMPDVTLSWEHFCSLRIDSQHLAYPLYGVAPDYRQALRLAWRRLRDDGAGRIGLALGPTLEPHVRDQFLMSYEFETHRLPPSARIAPAQPGNKVELQEWTANHSIDALLIGGFPADDTLWQAASKATTLISLDGPAAPTAVPAVTYDGSAIGTQAVEQTVMLMRTNQRGHPRAAANTVLPFRWRPKS